MCINIHLAGAPSPQQEPASRSLASPMPSSPDQTSSEHRVVAQARETGTPPPTSSGPLLIQGTWKVGGESHSSQNPRRETMGGRGPLREAYWLRGDRVAEAEPHQSALPVEVALGPWLGSENPLLVQPPKPSTLDLQSSSMVL